MKIRISLKNYEDLYDQFDSGHNRQHLESMRNFAVDLAKKYCPEKLEIVWVAATLHDIGISESRENHENTSFKIVKKDPQIKKFYSKSEVQEILEAVREHRATSGQPKSIVAKIISDADKTPVSTKVDFERAIAYGLKYHPQFDYNQQIKRAALHLSDKFGIEGYARKKVIFTETAEKIDKTYKPIFEALEKDDFKFFEQLLPKKCHT